MTNNRGCCSTKISRAASSEGYPASAHVGDLGLLGTPDRTIWQHAKDGGFVLVSKDEDFHRLSIFHGPPPKVIWIRLGNCLTEDIIRLLRERCGEIEAFVTH